MFRNQSDDDTLQPSWDLTLELHTEEGGLSDEDAAAAVVGGKRKKKMLSSEQARALERSFEMGSKLEPERKIELARALGLPPRQVSIWFQNRRARWKTKRLEKDYGELKRTLDAMKAQNEALQAQNKKLFCEVLALQGREASEPINLNKETEGSCSMRSDNSSADANLGTSRAPPPVHGSPSTPHQGILFFPSYCPPGACQIGMSSSRPGTATPSKVESSSQEDKCFCTSMFSRTDDQSALWAWQEQHSFHH